MIYHADCRSIPLPDGCVQCVITSPPYYGLRDYGVEGQIGLEATPELYLDTMVAVFREIKRVLRDDGTVFLNIGDSYFGSGKGRNADGTHQEGGKQGTSRGTIDGYKPKDLMGMPWRLAFALQADGWYLRSDIIWAKPNPMPESVTDRPTRSHEYIFLLTKRSSYYYDADAIREKAGAPPVTESRGAMRSSDLETYGLTRGKSNPSCSHPAGRNRRDVWTIPSQATPEAHFATFPEKLVEPCVLAGTSAKGCCSECGAPYVRETETSGGTIGKSWHPHTSDIEAGMSQVRHSGGVGNVRDKNGEPYRRETLGWRATCTHDAAIQPCLVFDSFLGSGTVGVVCERLGRRWAGTELSEAYIEIARKRTCQQGLFSHAIAN